MYRIDPENIKAIHLIEKILDLKAMTIPTDEWTEEFYIHNFPRQLRVIQIKCLCEIFFPELSAIQDLRIKTEQILNGDIIEKRDLMHYASFVEEIKKFVNIKFVDIEAIKEIFLNLLAFKIAAEKFIGYNSNLIESSGTNHYPIRLQNEITRQIDLTIINDNLNLIIDPLNRTFLRGDLIIGHNYPKEDSFDADIDWM